MIFLEYPKCSTCKKAKYFLDEHHINYEDRHIISNNPTKSELEIWIKKANRPIKTFFNTSGNLYKELNLKEKLLVMSEEEKLELLSSNGMLVKRPMLICGDIVLSGFKESEWKEILEK